MKKSSYTPTAIELTIFDFCRFHGQFVVAPKYIDDIPTPKSKMFNDLRAYRKKHIDANSEDVVANIMWYINQRFKPTAHQVANVSKLDLGTQLDIISSLIGFYGNPNIRIEDFGKYFAWNYSAIAELEETKTTEFNLKQEAYDAEIVE